jgi:hypothetical protein
LQAAFLFLPVAHVACHKHQQLKRQEGSMGTSLPLPWTAPGKMGGGDSPWWKPPRLLSQFLQIDLLVEKPGDVGVGCKGREELVFTNHCLAWTSKPSSYNTSALHLHSFILSWMECFTEWEPFARHSCRPWDTTGYNLSCSME